LLADDLNSRGRRYCLRGDIAVVESDTRALSNLGRLATVRDELFNGDDAR